MFIKILIIGFSTLFLAGCATNQAKDYLKSKKIDQGITFTKKELTENPKDSDMNYYYGRFLVSKKNYKESINYFKLASENSPFKTYYKFWLGVAYGKNKEYQKERQIYKEILNEKVGRYKLALAYLGRNYYKTKEYKKAIQTFEKALNTYKKPHSYMYYYYALSLKKTNQHEKAKEYFNKYLKTFPNYSLAKGAIYNLNKYGDFNYSNFKIANKIVSIKNIDFLNRNNEIEYYSKQSLVKISKTLLENKNSTLYIVSYDEKDKKEAEKKVKSIKKFILKEFPEIKFSDIKIAWLQSTKKIKVGKKSFVQKKYINFFTKDKKDVK